MDEPASASGSGCEAAEEGADEDWASLFRFMSEAGVIGMSDLGREGAGTGGGGIICARSTGLGVFDGGPCGWLGLWSIAAGGRKPTPPCGTLKAIGDEGNEPEFACRCRCVGFIIGDGRDLAGKLRCGPVLPLLLGPSIGDWYSRWSLLALVLLLLLSNRPCKALRYSGSARSLLPCGSRAGDNVCCAPPSEPTGFNAGELSAERLCGARWLEPCIAGDRCAAAARSAALRLTAGSSAGEVNGEK